MLTGLIIVSIVLVAITLVVVWQLAGSNSAARRELAGQSASISLLQQQLEGIKDSQGNFGEKLEKNIQAGQVNIGKHLLASQETLSKLHTQIGKIQGASEQMSQLGGDVRSLQDILKNPKLRGQMGERSLENLLGDILPAGSFELQYGFRNGKVVDALVKMPDHSVPVDAKFPLPAFEAMIREENEEERLKLRQQFLKDVKTHIDKIAGDYINPAEGTLDFALMYIPAENVYYETVIKYGGDRFDLSGYALEKKVIPVSPNLLYVYLMTIVMGLHGLQIEKEAGEIRQNLKKLTGSFGAFGGTWEVLGRHLRNAQGQYEEGNGKLNKLTMELEHIQSSEQASEVS